MSTLPKIPQQPNHFHLKPSNEYNQTTIDDAVDCLVKLQQARQSALKSSSTIHGTISQTHKYLQRLDIDISTMNFIHVAGSKGKGSTSTYVENLLCHSGYTTGLYTSPNLVSITERFRINTKTVSDELFLKAMWTVWDRLVATAGEVPLLEVPITDLNTPLTSPQPIQSAQNTQQTLPLQASTRFIYEYPPYPAYFQFLTLVAFFLYQMLKIDIIVMEVGLGGRVDATNVINPLVTAITTLSLEHTEILGSTLDKIAYSKTGIFKKNVPIVIFPQKKEAWDVILTEAKKANAIPLLIYSESSYSNIQLGIPGEYQPQNANLAVLIAAYAIKALKRKGFDGSNKETLKFSTITSLSSMYQLVQDEFLCDTNDDIDTNDDVLIAASDDIDTNNVKIDKNNNFTNSLLRTPSLPPSPVPSERTSVTQYVSSDVYLLQTLRSFNTLINNSKTTPIDVANISKTNVVDVTDHNCISPSEDYPSGSPTQTTKPSTIISFKADPIVNPDMNLDQWVDMINHDISLYCGVVEKLGLNQSPFNDQIDQQSILTSIEQLNNLLKLSIVAYDSQINYLSFHTTTITPSIIRALCTTTLRGRCDTVYNTFTLPFIEQRSSPISKRQQDENVIVIDPSCGCPKTLQKLRVQQEEQQQKQLDIQSITLSTSPSSHNSQESQSFVDIQRQIDYQSSILWHIDGAHTPESITACTHWYLDKVENEPVQFTIQRERALLLDAIRNMKKYSIPGDLKKTTPPTDLPSSSSSFPLIQQPTQRKCIKVLPLDAANYNGLKGVADKMEYNGVFTPFQQKVLMFNCGHVRSPFVLLKPLMEAFFNKLVYSHYQANYNILRESKQFNKYQHTTPDPSQQQQFYSIQVNLPFFEHIFFCPFDLDKPTDVPLPSLMELFQQNDLVVEKENNLNNSKDSHSTNNTETNKQPYNFNIIPDLIANGSYVVNTNDNTSSGNTTQTTTRFFKPQVWQLQTLVVLDHLITQELSTSSIQCDVNIINNDMATLYTLKEITQHQQVVPTPLLSPCSVDTPLSSQSQTSVDETTIISTNIQYNTQKYYSPLSQVDITHNHEKSNTNNNIPQHPFLSHATLPFTPPIATLARTLSSNSISSTFETTPEQGLQQGLQQNNTVFYHVMVSSRDTVMAVQYLAAQHYDSTHAQRNTTNSNDIVVDDDNVIQSTTLAQQHDTTTRALVVGSLYLAGNVLQYLKCKI